MKPHHTVTMIALLSLSAATTAVAQQSNDQLKQRVLAQGAKSQPRGLRVHAHDPQRDELERQDGEEGHDREIRSDEIGGRTLDAGLHRWRAALGGIVEEPPEGGSETRHRAGLSSRWGILRHAGDCHRVGWQDSVSLRLAAERIDLILGTDVSHNASAEASVSEANGAPLVEQVRITVKPMRVKLVMKLDRLENIARYRIGAGGKPFLMESTSDMSGSGMGQEGTMRNTTTYSDYRAVR